MSSDVLWFVLLTVAISVPTALLAFWLVDQPFEDPRVLPLLLLTIWSPNVAAVLLAGLRGELVQLLQPVLAPGSLVAWVGALLPLAVALGLGVARGVPLPGGGLLLGLVAMNLIMGPLGEELGWRGYLLPRLVPELGLVGAALVVGVVWALWHLPLWAFDTPQAEIPFWVFFVSCVCFSLVMTALWHAGGGALGPMVLFHLLANVGVGWLLVSGGVDGAAAYRAGLPLYAFAALVAVVWLAGQGTAVAAVDSAAS